MKGPLFRWSKNTNLFLKLKRNTDKTLTNLGMDVKRKYLLQKEIFRRIGFGSVVATMELDSYRLTKLKAIEDFSLTLRNDNVVIGSQLT